MFSKAVPIVERLTLQGRSVSHHDRLKSMSTHSPDTEHVLVGRASCWTSAASERAKNREDLHLSLAVLLIYIMEQ
jgi:hypothetical protein